MTLQAIRNALYNHLTSCGPYAASEISTCSYNVLETVAASAITFFPGTDSTFIELSGTGTTGTDENSWAIEGSIYIKDTGDPERTLSLAWQAPDDFITTLKKDRTLGGAANNAHVLRVSFDPRVGLEAGGAYWAEVRWMMRAEEYMTL